MISPARKLSADLRASLDETGALIERLAGLAGEFSRTVADFKSDHSHPEPPSDDPAPSD